MDARRFSLPKAMADSLESFFESHSLKAKKLKEITLSLSERYKTSGNHSLIWESQDYFLAYRCYFHVLNSLRIQAVLKEAEQLGFFKSSFSRIYDFGSGLGTGIENFIFFDSQFKNSNFTSIESSSQALAKQKEILSSYSVNVDYIQADFSQWENVTWENESLAFFSYSLNEVEEAPEFLFDAEHLMIVEPGTRENSRKLLQLRQKLMDRGFQVLAPCTHQASCPMLSQSRENWCFDRIQTDLPDWFQETYRGFPIKNEWLAFSYLIASKSRPTQNHGKVRVIGTPLKEKGKTRQMVCRGEKKEFFSWLKKYKNEEWIPQGACVELPKSFELKGDEIRILNFEKNKESK